MWNKMLIMFGIIKPKPKDKKPTRAMIIADNYKEARSFLENNLPKCYHQATTKLVVPGDGSLRKSVRGMDLSQFDVFDIRALSVSLHYSCKEYKYGKNMWK